MAKKKPTPEEAVEAAAAETKADDAKPPSATSKFTINDDGRPYPTQRNIHIALLKLGVRLWYDLFAGRLMIDKLDGFGPELDDEAVDRLWLRIDTDFGFRPAKEFFYTVIRDVGRRNSFHPVLDYLDGQKWDGTPRVDRWLIDYAGAEDTPYTRAVSALMLLAAVRRVRQPACKFDEILVLKSPQGFDKSSGLRILAVNDKWFTDALSLSADSKQVIEALSGRWIVEIGELKGIRRSDVEHVKNVLSRQEDRARMAYGRLEKTHLRQNVFFGTTNSETFLRDITGNRRFWPVDVKVFDLEALKRDRDQLWAEAAKREADGESIRLDPSLYAAAAAEQEKRRIEDPWVHTLLAWLGDKKGKIKAFDVWDIVGVPPSNRTQEHNDRLGGAMRELGWERKQLRFGGPLEYCYVKGTKGERQKQVVVQRDTDGKVYQVCMEGKM